MPQNNNLANAKNQKNDEFYTQYADIQKEVNAYLDCNPDVFRGKTILLPCDDPEWSNFTKFFAQNFEFFGLKKLISTSFAVESKKYKEGYMPTLFETESPTFDRDKTRTHGKIFTLDHDTNCNGRIDINDLQWTYLEDDGDFRSKEVTALRDEADIIITNPPFSLFREFLAWIMEGSGQRFQTLQNDQPTARLETLQNDQPTARLETLQNDQPTARLETCPTTAATEDVCAPKQFLIIGTINAITYSDTFPLIMNNKIWLGVSSGSKTYTTLTGGTQTMGNTCWFTNIEHSRRHKPLQLMTTAENIKYSKHKEIKGLGYLPYDNYNAIEVPYYDAIPADFEGIMGVPVSFVEKYCPEQFEILGMTDRDSPLQTKKYTKEDTPKYGDLNRRGAILVDGELRSTFTRILIRFRK